LKYLARFCDLRSQRKAYLLDSMHFYNNECINLPVTYSHNDNIFVVVSHVNLRIYSLVLMCFASFLIQLEEKKTSIGVYWGMISEGDRNRICNLWAYFELYNNETRKMQNTEEVKENSKLF
jgi:hypothetical protein